MEHMISDASSASSPKYDFSSRSQQPLYTTAGTIYDPSTTQRLQPPTRRGRLMNWPPGGAPHPFGLDSSYLPRSGQVDNASRIPRSRAAPSPSPAHLAYQPLQQNFDRAITPPSQRDRVQPQEKITQPQEKITMPPQVRSRNVHGLPISSVAAEYGHGHSSVDHETPRTSDFSYGDEDCIKKPLDHLPVKALFNLMSYPNPNQEQARKRWEDARQTGLGGLGGLGTIVPPPGLFTRSVSSPSPFPAMTTEPDDSFKPVNDLMPQSLVDWHQRLPLGGRARGSSERMTAASSPTSDSTYIYQPTPIHAGVGSARLSGLLSVTTATGTGVPSPLTAGPPGHRQYKASTFETTIKAFQGRAQSPLDEKAGPAGRSESRVPSGDWSTKSLLANSEPLEEYLAVGDWDGTNQNPPSFDMARRAFLGQRFAIAPGAHRYSSGSPERRISVNNRTLPKITGPTPSIREGGRMTEEEQERHIMRINHYWYAGTELMDSMMDAVMEEDATDPGGEDGSQGGVQQSRFGVRNRHFMTVEAANKMPAEEHARPLLEMAFVSVERHLKGGFELMQHGRAVQYT